MKPLFKYLGYGGAGIFFFLFFLLWTFPYDLVLSNVIHRIESQLGANYQIKVQEKGGGLLLGFSFQNVEILREEKGEKKALFKASKIKIRPSLLAFLTSSGSTEISFLIRTNKGDIHGDYKDTANESRIRLDLDPLDLSDFKVLNTLYQINLRGFIEGEIDLSLSKKGFDKNSGTIELKLAHWVMDPVTLNTNPSGPAFSLLTNKPTIELPKINLTGSKSSKLTIHVNKENIEFKELSLKGGDIDFSLKGKMTLAENPDASKLALNGSLKLNPQTEDKIFQELPGLSSIQSEKQADGSLPLDISGPYSKLFLKIGNGLPIPLRVK